LEALLRGPVPIELSSPILRIPGQLIAPVMVQQQVPHRLRQLLRVTMPDKPPGPAILDRIAQTRDVRSHHRGAAGIGFQNREAPTLLQGWIDDDVRPLQQEQLLPV